MKVKDATRKINGMIEVLQTLAQGQGYAGVNVFDAGAGGGDSWNIQINLERDGLSFGRKSISKDDLRKAITDLLKQC